MLASGVLQLHGKMRLIRVGDGGGGGCSGKKKTMRLCGERKGKRIAAATIGVNKTLSSTYSNTTSTPSTSATIYLHYVCKGRQIQGSQTVLERLVVSLVVVQPRLLTTAHRIGKTRGRIREFSIYLLNYGRTLTD